MTKDEKQLLLNSIQSKLDSRLKKRGVEAELYFRTSKYIEAIIKDSASGITYLCVNFNILEHICSITFSQETQVVWYDPHAMQEDCKRIIDILEGLKIFYCVLPSQRGL